MRMMTSDTFDHWIRGAGLVALVALVWAAVVPDGILWIALLAAGLMGAAIATSILVRSRQVPSLAQVIANSLAEPLAVSAPGGHPSATGLRPTGERKP